jgi:hypothetical protein
LVFGLVVARAAAGQAASSPPVESSSPCPEGRVEDIQPQAAILGRLEGKKGRIFIESCLESGPAGRTPAFDAVLVLSGPDVMGGTVGIIAQGECVVGHKFLGMLEFIHAVEMVHLFGHHPALQAVEHLDLDVLTQLAEDGEPAAQFHVGFVKAMGWGTARDRAGSIEWFRRAAEAGYEPGTLALGMSLAGPGVVDEQVLPIGEERPRDEYTDLAQACYWLRRLGQSEAEDSLAEPAHAIYEQEVAPRLTTKEKKACRALLQQRK